MGLSRFEYEMHVRKCYCGIDMHDKFDTDTNDFLIYFFYEG